MPAACGPGGCTETGPTRRPLPSTPALQVKLVLKAMIVLAAGLIAAAWQPCRAEIFQDLLERAVEAEGLAGGELLVSAPHLRRVVVAGVANRDSEAPIRPDSRFYVASVGKMATAVAALQMVEEGRLSFDAPVAGLAAGIPGLGRLANARTARLGQLLDHSSGIPDYLTDKFAAASRAEPARRWKAAEALSFAYGEPPSGRPGQLHDYSNSNFVLLGEIVAAAGGASFETLLAQRVLTPAGMTETTVGAGPDRSRLVHGYAVTDDEDEEEDVSLPCWNAQLGDGPLVATAGDLEKFLFALFRDGRLLSPAMLRRMVTPSDLEPGYGLGLELGEDRWGRWYGHTGSFDGFEAEARYYPDHRAVIVYLANGNSSPGNEIVDRAAAALLRSQ